jgi:hypothetical protein
MDVAVTKLMGWSVVRDIVAMTGFADGVIARVDRNIINIASFFPHASGLIAPYA